MIKRYGLLGIAILAGLALTLVAWQAIPWPYTYRGVRIDPPVAAADFTLTNQNNQPFQLGHQRGKVTLLFFGYTHCPDVCPVTLSIFSQVYKSLGAQADQVNFVFVTVDPERDTPQILNKYLANFSAPLNGLTADREQLAPVWKDYGVYQARQGEDGDAGYLVDHSARVYAIDRKGNWQLTYPFGVEAQDMAADVEHLLKEK
jgi:protein SCO1/2